MLILDVSDPALPTRLGSYDTLGSVRLVAIAGRHAYAVDANWLLILDVSNPAIPLRVGVYEVAGGINAIKAHGGRLYVLDGTGTLRILDVADPQHVTALGSYNSWGAGGSGLAVSGSYAWLPLGTAGLQVLDVSNPTNLTWLAGAWINPAEDVR